MVDHAGKVVDTRRVCNMMSRNYTKKLLMKTGEGPLWTLDGSNYFTFFRNSKAVKVFVFTDKFHALNYWKRWACEKNMSISEVFGQEISNIRSSCSDEGTLPIREMFLSSKDNMESPKHFEMLFDGYLNDVAEDATNILFDLIEMRAASKAEDVV